MRSRSVGPALDCRDAMAQSSPTRSPTKTPGSPVKLVSSLRRSRKLEKEKSARRRIPGGSDGKGSGVPDLQEKKKEEPTFGAEVRCPANFIYRHCFSSSFDIVSLCCNDAREQVLCSDNHKLYLWSTRTRELLHSAPLPPDSTTDSLFYNRFHDVYYAVRNRRRLLIFYASGSRILQEMTFVDAHVRPILCVCHAPKQNLVLTTGVESVIKVWKTELTVRKQGGKVQYKSVEITKSDDLDVPAGTGGEWLRDMLYDPIHARIFAVQEVNIQVWNVETGFLMYVLMNVHDMPITCIAFREGTKHLFTASMDKTIKIWDVKESELRLVETLLGHNAPVKSICIHEETSSLFSVDNHGCLKRWHLSDFEEWDSLQLPQFSGGNSDYDEIIQDRDDISSVPPAEGKGGSRFVVSDTEPLNVLSKGMAMVSQIAQGASGGLPLFIAFGQNVALVEYHTSTRFLSSCSHPVIRFQILQEDELRKSLYKGKKKKGGVPVSVLCKGSTIHMMYTAVGHDSKLLAPKAPLVGADVTKGDGTNTKGHLAEISTLICHKSTGRIIVGWSSGHTSIVDVGNGQTIQFIESNENDSSAITAMEFIVRGNARRLQKTKSFNTHNVSIGGGLKGLMAANKWKKNFQKQVIILGTEEGTIILHQLPMSQFKPEVHKAHAKRVMFLEHVISGRQFIISAGMEGVIKIWHLHDKAAQSRAAGISGISTQAQKSGLLLVTALRSISSAALTCFTLNSFAAKQSRRDPVEVAVGLQDGNVEFWRLHLSRLGGRRDVMTGMLSSDPAIACALHKRALTSICVHQSSSIYASSSEDFSVIIWKVLRGKHLQQLVEIPFRMAPTQIAFINEKYDMLVAFGRFLCVTQPTRIADFEKEVFSKDKEIVHEASDEEEDPVTVEERSRALMSQIERLPPLSSDKVRMFTSNSKVANDLHRKRQEVKNLQRRKEDVVQPKRQTVNRRAGRRRSIFTLPDVSLARQARRGSFFNVNPTASNNPEDDPLGLNFASALQTTYLKYQETDLDHLKKAVIIPQGAKKLADSFLSADLEEKPESMYWTEIREAVSETNFTHTFPKKLMIDMQEKKKTNTKKKKKRRRAKKKKEFESGLVDRWKTLLNSEIMPSIQDRR